MANQCWWSFRTKTASFVNRLSQILTAPSSPPVTKWQCLFGLQSRSRTVCVCASSMLHAQLFGSRISYDRTLQSISAMNWLPWWCSDHFPVVNFGEFFALISATTRVFASVRACSRILSSTTVANEFASDLLNSVVRMMLPNESVSSTSDVSKLNSSLLSFVALKSGKRWIAVRITTCELLTVL